MKPALPRRFWPCILLASMASCRPAPPADYERLPVLMVHGLGDSRETFKALSRDLERLGWPRAYLLAPSLIPPDGDNIAAAEMQLRPAAETLLARATRARALGDGGPAPSRILVIGHSMGALSARWFATRVWPERVSALVTLAGANHGTNAFCEQKGAGPDDMCPAFARTDAESRIQVELNGTLMSPRDETPFSTEPDAPNRRHIGPDSTRRIAYLALRAEEERWIVPDSSTRLDGAVNQLFRHTDHDRLAREPGLATIVDSLERAAR